MRHEPKASTSFDLIVGVDTYKKVHVAVAIDQLGRNLGLYELSVSNSGYQALEMWAQTPGKVALKEIEGTVDGCWARARAQLLPNLLPSRGKGLVSSPPGGSPACRGR